MIGLIKHNFIQMDTITFCLSYKVFVRPHVEYAHSAWYPHKKEDIDEIEKLFTIILRNSFKVSNQRFSQDIKKYSFIPRVINIWNSVHVVTKQISGDIICCIELFTHRAQAR